ncbi:hypothetical protein H2198_005939 [Neophaeococcomyces mojaviensis]|uniref:Uncharacterized protein n=1 Tax=Neophaeococcomyces mojaviensis TaxID=3383035 RepID=A0ACC3A4V7_9EURO|nr:hypothetical protein H2198_005939 [Knufia sp. JES_112]
MAPAPPRSGRSSRGKQKELRHIMEDTVARPELPPPSLLTNPEASSLFHDIEEISDSNIQNVRIHTSPSRKVARQIACSVSDYYLYLSESQQVNPHILLSDLAHVMELLKPMLRQDNNGRCVFDTAISNEQERELVRLRQEIEERYTTMMTDVLSDQVNGLLKLKPASYNISMENTFSELAKDISAARGAMSGINPNIHAGRWATLVPNLLGLGIDSIIPRLDNTHQELQRFVYLEFGGERAKLWYLVWKNLKKTWIIFKECNSSFPTADYALESRFYRARSIQDLFKHIVPLPDFFNSELIENLVGYYCAFINYHRHLREVRSEQLRGWDPELPISNEASGELIKQMSSYAWEPKARSALHWAVIRLTCLTNGPVVVRRNGNLADDWSVEDLMKSLAHTVSVKPTGVEPSTIGASAQKESSIKNDTKSHLEVLEQLIPQNFEYRSAQDLLFSPSSTIKSLGSVEYLIPEGKNMTVAYDYVYHPFPENRAQEVAESRRIARDLRDPGILSEGTRIEDCINLPLPHVRPPGTYTGHRQRRRTGPYDYLKILGEELVRWITWQPYPVRRLPRAPLKVTTRSSCRLRKIAKEMKRERKLQGEIRRNSKTVRDRPLQDSLNRVTKLGRRGSIGSTVSQSRNAAKMRVLKLRGGGYKTWEPMVRPVPPETWVTSKLHLIETNIDNDETDVDKRKRELGDNDKAKEQLRRPDGSWARAEGSPTPAPQRVGPSNGRRSSGPTETDVIPIPLLVNPDDNGDNEPFGIHEDNNSPERRRTSNEENSRPHGGVEDVGGLRNPLQVIRPEEEPAEPEGPETDSYVPISPPYDHQHSACLNMPMCHPCPCIEGQWHHQCDGWKKCPGAREFIRWHNDEVAGGRWPNPYIEMQREHFGPYFARIHASNERRQVHGVNTLNDNTVHRNDDNSDDSLDYRFGSSISENGVPSPQYARGPRDAFYGVLIANTRYDTPPEAVDFLSTQERFGRANIYRTYIDGRDYNTVQEAREAMDRLARDLPLFGMRPLPVGYYGKDHDPPRGHIVMGAPKEFTGIVINGQQYDSLALGRTLLQEMEEYDRREFRYAFFDGRQYLVLEDAAQELRYLASRLNAGHRMERLPPPARSLRPAPRHFIQPTNSQSREEAEENSPQQRSNIQEEQRLQRLPTDAMKRAHQPAAELPRPILFRGVMINGHLYREQDRAEHELGYLVDHPGEFVNAHINGYPYNNVVEARNAFNGLQDLLRRGEPMRSLPRRSAIQRAQEVSEIRPAPAANQNRFPPPWPGLRAQLSVHNDNRDKESLSDLRQRSGQNRPSASRPPHWHHVRDYEAEDVAAARPNSIGLKELRAWQDGLPAGEIRPELERPQVSGLQPDELTPDQEQLQKEQEESIRRRQRTGVQQEQDEGVTVNEEEEEPQGQIMKNGKKKDNKPAQKHVDKAKDNNKGKKPQKARKGADADLIDLTKANSPKRTRTGRREGRKDEKSDNTKESAKNDTKRRKKKQPNNIDVLKDKPNNDDDNPDNNPPDGAVAAKGGRRTTQATATVKAQTRPTTRASTGIVGKPRQDTDKANASKKRSYAEIANDGQEGMLVQPVYDRPAISNLHPLKRPRTSRDGAPEAYRA